MLYSCKSKFKKVVDTHLATTNFVIDAYVNTEVDVNLSTLFIPTRSHLFKKLLVIT